MQSFISHASNRQTLYGHLGKIELLSWRLGFLPVILLQSAVSTSSYANTLSRAYLVLLAAISQTWFS